MWDVLPGDVAVRILLLLPVKDVIRCSSLQKSWYSLVHSKPFVESYNRHSRLFETNPSLLILKFSAHHRLEPQLSLRHNNTLLVECMPIRYPRRPVFSVSNSCNGLFCLFDSRRFFLWNPVIRKTLTLPNPSFRLGSLCFLGLGFVYETSDYKVLMFNKNDQVELYSLQHHSWNTLVHPEPGTKIVPTDYTVNTPVSVKSSLYWLRIKDQKNVVGVFDFKDEAFSDISIPEDWDSPMKTFVCLRKHSESSIAFVRSTVCDLGTQKAYCHIHVMDVNTKTRQKHSIEGSNWGRRMDILGFNKEGDEVIRWLHFDLFSDLIPKMCTHKNGKFMKIVKPVHGVEASNYVTSLALLDVVAKPRLVKRRRFAFHHL